MLLSRARVRRGARQGTRGGRRAGRGGQSGEGGRVEPGYVGHVGKVDELEEIAVLDAVFDADVLVLVIEVFAPLGEADGGEAFLVEAGVVATAEVTVVPKDEDGVECGDESLRGQSR